MLLRLLGRIAESHSLLDSFSQDHGDRLTGSFGSFAHLLLILYIKMPKDIIRKIHPVRLCTDADPDPHEILRTEMLDDAFHSIMPAGTALFTDPELPDIQIDIVVQDDELLLRINMVIIAQSTDALAAQVHVGLRHRQKDLLSLNHSRTGECAALRLSHADPIMVRDL